MGCIIGSLISTVACCFCSATASLCCTCIPSCKSSTSSRLMYLFYFTLSIIVSVAMLNFNFGDWLKNIPVICQPINPELRRVNINFNYNCTFSSNHGGIYRCCFGLSFFFFIFSLLMIRVKSSAEIRGKINNGFWLWKLILLVTLIVGSLFILPDPYFSSTWLVFGMIGGFLYILIQLVLIVDFAHVWNEKWVDKYENDNDNKYYYALLSFTSIFYLSSLSLIIFMIYYFGSYSSCHLHRFFILFNLILSIVASGLSVSPKIQEYTQRSGLLQASLITFYTTILTWGGLISSPDIICNPILEQEKFDVNNYHSNFPNNSIIRSEINIYKLEWSYYLIISIVFYYILIIYFSVRDSFSECRALLPDQNTEATTISTQRHGSSENKNKGQIVEDNEKDGVKYDYSLFHFIYCLGAIYIQMTITNWYSLHSDIRALKINPMAMWIKICGAWISVFLYIWTLLAPLMFPDRDFN